MLVGEGGRRGDDLLGAIAPHADVDFGEEGQGLLRGDQARFLGGEREAELGIEKSESERKIFALTKENIEGAKGGVAVALAERVDQSEYLFRRQSRQPLHSLH